MIKKIIGTLGTRLLTAVLTLTVWVLNANYLGSEEVGTIGLMIFSVAIIQLLTNFMAGSALIYMVPRVGVFRLLVPAYVWTPLITLASVCGMFLISRFFPDAEVIPHGYYIQVAGLALVMSFTSVNYMLLLGLEKVKVFNICNMVQIIGLFVVLLMFLFGFHFREVMSYYWAIFISYSVVFLLSLMFLMPAIRREPLSGMKALVAEIFRFGTYVQFANFFQTLNYRLSLKFVDLFLGRAAVGVLTVGLQLAEGLWLISRSISTVQYSRMSNEMNYDYSVKLTLTFTKITWMITGLAMVVLLCIPQNIFVLLFSKSFVGIKPVIASLAAGIVFLSVSMILSAFYSAINKPYHNTASSALGLVFTVILGFTLIPEFGITGAGITASISYFFITLYQVVVFKHMAGLSLRDFLLTSGDVRRMRALLFTKE